MVPVRKPGRPLSTCPCPPGRPCACGGVRVAIPRKKKCKCPSDSSNEADGSEQEQSPAETPTSPSRPSFRVSKSNPSSKANSRKQSFDPSTLERMDPRSINLLVSPNGNGSTNGRTVVGNTDPQGSSSELSGFGAGIGLVPAGPGNGYVPSTPAYATSIPYNMGHQFAQSNQLQNGIKLEDGGLRSPPGNFVAPMLPPPFMNGSHSSPSISSPPQPAVLGTPPLHKPPNATSGGGSCCGGKKTTPPSPSLNNASSPQPGFGQPFMQQFQPSSDMKPQDMHSFTYPTVFTYPAQYGSWQQPIDPTIWQQVASQSSMPLTTPMPPAANEDMGDMGLSHQCKCGEGCQCVGCLAHPFNARMFQYVNDAYSDSNGGSPAAAGMGSGGAAPDAATAPAGGLAQTPAPAPGQASPQLSEGSPPREEQSLSTMDYFFVNLPISGLCGGSMETCPCGDGCECPGCMVHNVPL